MKVNKLLFLVSIFKGDKTAIATELSDMKMTTMIEIIKTVL